jgi:hypothetical protein
MGLRGRRPGRGSGTSGWILAGLLLASLALGPGCSSRQKKLSQGGSMTDILFYDLMGRDRTPNYYYELVRNSHREKDFCYECSAGDPYLVDKNIDAVERLGRAGYGRLEGMAEVVELFSEVITEDRSSLARAQAATSRPRRPPAARSAYGPAPRRPGRSWPTASPASAT